MPSSFDAQMALCGNKPMHSHLTSLRAANVIAVSPRTQITVERKPYISEEASKWYRCDQNGYLPPPVARPPSATSKPAASPHYFSGLGQPSAVHSKVKSKNNFQPTWQGPKPGWATELLPVRPGWMAQSLCNKNQPPITDAERQLPCWKDCPPPPRPKSRERVRDPIHGVPAEESAKYYSQSLTTTREAFG